MNDYPHSETTEAIIKAAYKVYNTLGSGFVEKVYENALAVDLRKRGLNVQQQTAIHVFYEGEVVGDFVADLVVENKVIVELKAVSELIKIHEVQLVNYLKATDIEIGLLINFGPNIQINRRVCSNQHQR